MKTKKLLDKNGNPIQIEQGQVRGLKEALANVSGGSGASGTPSKTYQELTGPFFNNQDYIEIYNLSDKYTIIDLSNDVQRLEDSQGGDVSIELTNEDYTNAVVLIKKPLSADIPNYLHIYFGRIFIVCHVQNGINVEGVCMDNTYDLYLPLSQNYTEIRIEYDEFGAIKVYPHQDWEI